MDPQKPVLRNIESVSLSSASAAILFLALLLSHLLVLPVWAATIRVPQDVSTIQGAINAASNGDTVIVAPGTYVENINFLGKAITVASEQGPEATVIDGNFAGPVVDFVSGETIDSIIKGFKLTNGAGSAIRLGYQASAAEVTGNVLVGNRICSGGGAIEIINSAGAPIIRNNIISANRCDPAQGGSGITIMSSASQAQILDNVISDHDNRGISMLGGGTPIILGNTIRGNRGGGISLGNFTDAAIVQNLIIENGTAFVDGGGIYWLVPSGSRGPYVVNNTIVANESRNGSGIFADGYDAQTVLANNIIVAKAGQSAVFCGNFNDLNPPIFKSNDIFSPGGAAYGGICSDQTGLNGNISADPLFLDPSNGVYYLQSGSPAIDAGDNLAPELSVTDFDGDPRIFDGDGNGLALVDLGAFESPPSPGIIHFKSSWFTAAEVSGSAPISVIRKGGTAGQVSVDYATSNGTALAGLDYAPASGTLTFLLGESVKNFSVGLIYDKFDEMAETVKLNLSNVTGGATLGARSSSVLTINDAGMIQFSASSYNVMESGGGVGSSGTITVKRVGGSVGAVGVLFKASDGTATAGGGAEGSDYYPASYFVNFSDGDSTAKVVEIFIFDDGDYEGDETVNLALSSPTGGAVLGNPNTAVLTIIDNDSPPPPTVTVQMAPYFPIESGDFWTYQGDGGSFTRAVLSGSVTINGLATKALQDDNGFVQYFSNDSAGIRLHRQFSPNVDIGLRDPVDLRLTFSPPVVIANATMIVGQTVMTNGTATTNKLPRVGVLTLAYSASFTVQGFAIVTVPLGSFEALKLQGYVNVGGEVVEETLYLVENIGPIRLIDASGGITDTADLVATNNFSSPIVSVVATSPAASENGNSGIFTISRSGATTQLLTVSYTITGTATMGTDYKALTGSLTIPIGAVSANISIDPIDDILAEPDETVVLTLSASPSYSIGAQNSASITIVNNDMMNPVAHVDCATMSLQSVIDLAESGSTLLVNGVCSETIKVGNDLGRIQLDGGGGAVIVGTDPSAPAVLIRGKGILIQGFTISGGGDGIHVNRGSNAVIHNNWIENTNGNGILVDELAFAVITYNAIQNNPGAGVFISENSTARIGFNADTETVASPNTIQNNGAGGIIISNGSSARVIGNAIVANAGDGVLVTRDAQSDLADNFISGNDGNGIRVDENSFVQLGEDSGSTIFELPNSGSGNTGAGVKCVSGGSADGRQGSLTGDGGAASFDATCVTALQP